MKDFISDEVRYGTYLAAAVDFDRDIYNMTKSVAASSVREELDRPGMGMAHVEEHSVLAFGYEQL
jgi:hypothetical protein